MQPAPERTPSRPRPLALRLLSLALALFGGAGIGILLAGMLAPGSQLALLLGFLLLPTILVVGLHLWLGFAVLLVALDFLRRRARAEPSGSARNLEIPPGAWAFIAVGSIAGLAGGVLTGLLFATGSVLRVTLAYWAAGSAYGAALWFLARAGYLPFPEGD